MKKKFSHLLLNRETPLIESFEFLSGKVGLFSSKSPEKKRKNQDSSGVFHINNQVGILAVADGLGGHTGGAYASSYALKALDHYLQKLQGTPCKHHQIRNTLETAIDHIHHHLLKRKGNGGTTLAIAEVGQDYIRFYNIGDSVGLLINGQGEIKYKTLEHSPAGFGFEAGLLSDKEQTTFKDRNIIFNALGVDYYWLETSCLLTFSSHDLVLIASDGVTANMTHKELLERIRKESVEKRINKVTDLAQKRMIAPPPKKGHADDLTMLLYKGK